ncbi:MAG TPA: hypothetical protein VGO57_01740 [Verrucomicrobiae bacterium]
MRILLFPPPPRVPARILTTVILDLHVFGFALRSGKSISFCGMKSAMTRFGMAGAYQTLCVAPATVSKLRVIYTYRINHAILQPFKVVFLSVARILTFYQLRGPRSPGSFFFQMQALTVANNGIKAVVPADMT